MLAALAAPVRTAGCSAGAPRCGRSSACARRPCTCGRSRASRGTRSRPTPERSFRAGRSRASRPDAPTGRAAAAGTARCGACAGRSAAAPAGESRAISSSRSISASASSATGTFRETAASNTRSQSTGHRRRGLVGEGDAFDHPDQVFADEANGRGAGGIAARRTRPSHARDGARVAEVVGHQRLDAAPPVGPDVPQPLRRLFLKLVAQHVDVSPRVQVKARPHAHEKLFGIVAGDRADRRADTAAGRRPGAAASASPRCRAGRRGRPSRRARAGTRCRGIRRGADRSARRAPRGSADAIALDACENRRRTGRTARDRRPAAEGP